MADGDGGNDGDNNGDDGGDVDDDNGGEDEMEQKCGWRLQHEALKQQICEVNGAAIQDFDSLWWWWC